MRLPRLLRRQGSGSVHDERMAIAAKYARHLTESGSRCHLNDGSVRFCHWRGEDLPAADGAGPPDVGVRCTIHPGGRYLDHTARLDPEDFAPTRDD